MNDNYKDVQSIIAKHRDYFTSLSDIEIIRVFGHSYNIIDMPYFQKIKDSVSKEIRQQMLKAAGLYEDADVISE